MAEFDPTQSVILRQSDYLPDAPHTGALPALFQRHGGIFFRELPKARVGA